jgi:O-antigen/teichoic acid export membrane protein
VGTGINLALVRFGAEYLSRNNRRPSALYFLGFLFQTSVYAFLVMILMFFSGPASRLLFGSTEFQSSFRFGLIAGWGMLWLQAGRSMYQTEERYSFFVGATLFRELSVLILVALLAAVGALSFRNTAISIAIASLMAGIAVTYDVLRTVRWKRTRAFLKGEQSLLQGFLASTKWLIAYAIILVVLQQMGVFLLSHLSTEEQLALYGVAFRYYAVILLLLSSVHAVLLPRFSKEDISDSQRQKRFASRWFKYTVWVIVPIGVFALLGKPMFVWVNGVQYEGAFGILVVFLFGSWLSLTFSPMVNILIGRRDFRCLFSLSLGAFLVGLLACLVLVPKWGAVGAAFGAILPHAVINLGAFSRIGRG